MNNSISTEYKTEQEAFWAGQFGDDYIQRNQGDAVLASNLNFFTKALAHAQNPKSCIEFGANIGMNSKALKLLYPSMALHAIEINATAAQELATIIPKDHIDNTSILEWSPPHTHRPGS